MRSPRRVVLMAAVIVAIVLGGIDVWSLFGSTQTLETHSAANVTASTGGSPSARSRPSPSASPSRSPCVNRPLLVWQSVGSPNTQNPNGSAVAAYEGRIRVVGGMGTTMRVYDRAIVKTCGWRSLGGLAGCFVGGQVVVAFDEDAAFEAGSGADEGDQVGCVDGAPAGLGGLDQLERHRDPGGLGPRPLGDLGPVPDGREGGLDRVRGAQVDPVFGRVVVERQQLLQIVGDLRSRLGPLRAVQVRERLGRGLGVVAVFGAPDLGQGLLRARVRGLG